MKYRLLILLLLLSLYSITGRASHIVGGEVTYKYLGDSLDAFGSHIMYQKYEVNVIIYEDCQNGQPLAITEDNPAWIGVFTGLGAIFAMDTGDNLTGGGKGIPYSSSLPVPANFDNACVTKIPATCLLRKIFTKIYSLPYNTSGYVVAYQRCCRNNATINIVSPGNHGATYFCTIPPSPIHNTSAIFRNYPPQIICLNNPLFYDHSAFDADGDSLSYEFCAASLGADETDIKPPPSRPTLSPPVYYDSVQYFPPFTSKLPITAFPQIQIDPSSGIITGTPNRIGRYLVTVCCHEWRDGILINTMKREFQFVVTSCTKVVVADIPQYSTDPNTYIVNCENFTVHFENTSKGGFAYHWDFGVPGTLSDTSNLFDPTYTYPDTGTFSVSLRVNPSSTCSDSISRFTKIYPKFRANFTDTGTQCPGAPLQFIDLTSATLRPITYWKWNFGDGDSSFSENPVHTYSVSGLYNVSLISENIRSCVDTTIRELVIDKFRPFAGHDTFIVKGELIRFNATGGIKYAWSPATNLSDTTIYNPIGVFHDTGQFVYNLHVESPYGCIGDDTIKVQVLDHAAFFVPNAFSPNGDGLNDIFRPLAIGYRNLNYFRVFDRWGEQIYFTGTLESGWDGTYKGKPSQLGTYYWEISYTDRFGAKGFMKGDVVLVR
jgi:gliding motility-associated-like protein